MCIDTYLLFLYFFAGILWGVMLMQPYYERKMKRHNKETETIKINPNFKFPKA